MAKNKQYLLMDINKKLYNYGNGAFDKINECGRRSWSKDEVATRIKSDGYPFGDIGQWFFVEIKEDGSKRLLQKGDEI